MGLMDMGAKAKESAAAKDAAPPERNSDLARYNESVTNPAAGVLTNPDLLRLIGSFVPIRTEASKLGFSDKDAEDIRVFNISEAARGFLASRSMKELWIQKIKEIGYDEATAASLRGEKLVDKSGMKLLDIIYKYLNKDKAAEDEREAKRGGIKMKRIFYKRTKKNFSYDENNNVYDDKNKLFGKLVNDKIIKNKK
jgi:hypothetical protein